MNYLQQMIPLKSEKEYYRLMELITNLQEDILSIWEFIREPAKQQLWKELGGFYASPEDEEFIAMVESSTSIKLTELEEFKKKIFFANNNTATSLLLNSSIFKKPTKDIGKLNAEPVISCNPPLK